MGVVGGVRAGVPDARDEAAASGSLAAGSPPAAAGPPPRECAHLIETHPPLFTFETRPNIKTL